MDKGIRPAALAKFIELLPIRTEIGNTRFRRIIMNYLMEAFSCSNSAAATHYNHAFKQVKKDHPELVEGLGRAEGKNNGGRKRKEDAVPPAALTTTVPAALITAKPQPVTSSAVAAQASANNPAPRVGRKNKAAETGPGPRTFTVKKRIDDSMVAEGLTKDEADVMVAKAKVTRKAALYIA